MTLSEYKKLQSELSQLICNEKYKRMTSKNRDIYKKGILACKSVLSYYNPEKFSDKIEAEQIKHGYWVLMSNKYIYRCSLCGTMHIRTIYCPNCGAKMDLDEVEP